MNLLQQIPHSGTVTQREQGTDGLSCAALGPHHSSVESRELLLPKRNGTGFAFQRKIHHTALPPRPPNHQLIKWSTDSEHKPVKNTGSTCYMLLRSELPLAAPRRTTSLPPAEGTTPAPPQRHRLPASPQCKRTRITPQAGRGKF